MKNQTTQHTLLLHRRLRRFVGTLSINPLFNIGFRKAPAINTEPLPTNSPSMLASILVALGQRPVHGMAYFAPAAVSISSRAKGMYHLLSCLAAAHSWSSSQKNTDFSICHGVERSNISGIKRCVHLYDVNCQHCVNFRKRVEANPNYLSYPFDEIETISGIGEFHIHAHIPRCFPRHSTHFIPGVAVNDGEILETLWAEANEITPSCAPASLPNRTETIDDHFNTSNFKKGAGISTLFIGVVFHI